MKKMVLAFCCAVMTVSGASEAQQPRDTQPRAVSGTSAITGAVFSTDTDPLPLRRVRVILGGSELELSRSTITGDDGSFTFQGLPAGRYTLSAAKDGYATLAFGATRPGRPGRSLALGAGEVRQVTMQLPRGAVITGVVRDPHGEPASGFPILLLSRAHSLTIGERRLRPVPGINIVTDDRGEYRAFGLPAGSYVVAALPRGAGTPGDIATVSPEDVQRALAEVKERRTANRPGMPASAPSAPSPPARTAGLSFAPTYYPGTTLEERARLVTVAAGEVRTGIDFDLDNVPSTSISGSVAVPPGTRVQLMLTKADPDAPYQTSTVASPGPDGGFVFRRVQPGHYVINARGAQLGGTGGAAVLWGRTEVVAAGDDIDGVTVPLQPALDLSGELVFEGAEGAAPALDGLKLPLPVSPRSNSGAPPFPAAVIEGSRVVLRGLAPGAYTFRASPQGVRTRVGGWWLKSIVMDDREVLDTPLKVLPNTRTLRVTFSSKASELSGAVRDRDGGPIADMYVVVFPEDPKAWFQHSRRVAAVRLREDGRYTISNLPPGNYFVAVTSDLENNEWFDPEKLQALRGEASRVTIGENQSVSRDIAIGQRRP